MASIDGVRLSPIGALVVRAYSWLMTSPMSDLAISTARLEISRALQEVENLAGRTNKRLTEAGQAPLPPAFFPASFVKEMRAEHEAAIAALQPKYRWSHGGAPVAAPDEPEPRYGPRLEFAIEGIKAAIADRRLDDTQVLRFVRAICLIFYDREKLKKRERASINSLLDQCAQGRFAALSPRCDEPPPKPPPPKRPARTLGEIIATADAEDLAAIRDSFRIAEEQAEAEAEAEIVELAARRTPSLDERMAKLNLKPAGPDAPEPPKVNGAASTASFIVAMGALVERPKGKKS